jgi:small subunit ribosomal protein S2
VIAILDTNCVPDEVTYPIPGNDDAIRSVALLTRVVADAVADGLIARAGAAAGEEKPAGADGTLGAREPLAEWERELLEGSNAEAAANGAAANGAGTGATATATATIAPPEPAADDTHARPRPGGSEAASSDALAAQPDVIDSADEVPTDEVPADEAPAPAAGAEAAGIDATGTEAS